MRTGYSTLPLHGGNAPRWLFSRMVRLSRAISTILVEEYGPVEFLRRISDPYWFQALGCVLGFDWHSSGLTTTVCGALKEGLKGLERDTGLFICGGKGATSRRTPSEIENFATNLGMSNDTGTQLVHSSRMSAKVDSAAVQDGYQLYHHSFFFTADGKWAVVQQGMNLQTRTARRYHWYSEDFSDFVVEPHSAICCDSKGETLDLTSATSEKTRSLSVELVSKGITELEKDITNLPRLDMPHHHPVFTTDFNSPRLLKTLVKISQTPPDDFEALLATKGVGPKTIFSLAMVSELIYGTKPSWQDPARFSYTLGGKDGHPYPVARKRYDETAYFLEGLISKARLSPVEKDQTLRKLQRFMNI